MSSHDDIIAPARYPHDLAIVRSLFQDYLDSLGIDLSFQDVNSEMAGLPGKYSRPLGDILIAWDAAHAPLGCVALRPVAEPGACEIKRLYVRPEARGRNLGRRLAEAIIAYASAENYTLIRLDTLSSMQSALRLYTSLGFQRTAPYYHNPIPNAVYLALAIQPAG